MAPNLDVPMTVRLSPDLHASLRSIAVLKGRRLTDVIREALWAAVAVESARVAMERAGIDDEPDDDEPASVFTSIFDSKRDGDA